MIILSDEISVIKKFSGKSGFEFWQEVKEGDIIEILLEFSKLVRTSSGTKQPNVKLINRRNRLEFTSTFNKVIGYLDKIEYEEI